MTMTPSQFVFVLGLAGAVLSGGDVLASPVSPVPSSVRAEFKLSPFIRSTSPSADCRS